MPNSLKFVESDLRIKTHVQADAQTNFRREGIYESSVHGIHRNCKFYLRSTDEYKLSCIDHYERYFDAILISQVYTGYTRTDYGIMIRCYNWWILQSGKRFQ